MIISRSSALIRLHGFNGRNLLQNRFTKCLENTRHSHGASWGYRKPPPEKPVYINDICGAVAWWWITWHLITDFEELVGVPYPDPSKWTDEELGIPPI